ncbi:MAG: hypothetical protein A2284_09450 [Deltaproteobacteria bacterium RIFOXYA12_FULL_61_11]|nr:MAG: hypothetical protein A2284_09450 [Deltaproteobacteria bacterium RIFOXYA12_FULL_61_11]
MADRVDYYFHQKLTEAELDLGFELLEKADRNLAADLGLLGIISGAEPTPHAPVPDLTLDLTAPARAYDRLGQRISFGTGQTVNCAVDLVGMPTEVLTAGNERWLGLFLCFDRSLSDPRTDGNSQQVFFRRDEAFQLKVRQAPEGALGAAPKVALQDGELLLCDVLRRYGQTQLLSADLDLSRRQVFLFTTAASIGIVSELWNLLPTLGTVQDALDAVDTELTNHFGGTARHHPAADLDYTPHGFIAADTVQTALDELVDGLSSTAAGSPGASKVGADAVSGTPQALPAGSVDGQLSQLLGWINGHLGASSNAHHASAIRTDAHNYLGTTTVQGQFQELVLDLLSQTAGSAGAVRVGASAVSGNPTALTAGTVSAQLATLLSALNGHATAADNAHPAAAVSFADSGDRFNAVETELALIELMAILEQGHYRANQTTPGQHKAIVQPVLGTGKALVWDSLGIGWTGTRLRVLIDDSSVWFTLNAFWNGTAWQRDYSTFYAGGFRFSRNEFEILHDHNLVSTFTDWSRRWKLPLSSSVNSAFELTGEVQEVGRIGFVGTNTDNATRSMTLGGCVTFRNRFPALPSSITLTRISSSNWNQTPAPLDVSRDGFFYQATAQVAATTSVFWNGEYHAIA